MKNADEREQDDERSRDDCEPDFAKQHPDRERPED